MGSRPQPALLGGGVDALVPRSSATIGPVVMSPTADDVAVDTLTAVLLGSPGICIPDSLTEDAMLEGDSLLEDLAHALQEGATRAGNCGPETAKVLNGCKAPQANQAATGINKPRAVHRVTSSEL